MHLVPYFRTTVDFKCVVMAEHIHIQHGFSA